MGISEFESKLFTFLTKPCRSGAKIQLPGPLAGLPKPAAVIAVMPVIFIHFSKLTKG